MEKRYRFTSKNRLNKAKHYHHFAKGARRLFCQGLLLLAKNNAFNEARLGLVIAKRYTKKSNKRNTIKRVIRESFRYHQQLLVGYDVIVISQHRVQELTKPQLRNILDKQWKRLIQQLSK